MRQKHGHEPDMKKVKNTRMRMCRLSKGLSKNRSTEEKPNCNSGVPGPGAVASQHAQKRKATQTIITAQTPRMMYGKNEGKAAPIKEHNQRRCSTLATGGHGIIHGSKGQAITITWQEWGSHLSSFLPTTLLSKRRHTHHHL